MIETKIDALKSLTKSSGIHTAAKMVGGIKNYVDIVYDGNIIDYSKDCDTYLVKISDDGAYMYISDILVELLNFKNRWDNKSKELGDFRYGAKNDVKYLLDAWLERVKFKDEVKWKVVGTSGSKGFGVSFISSREVLAKRYRKQIFKQIIDKYNLSQYITK
jgi:hypothetical protein